MAEIDSNRETFTTDFFKGDTELMVTAFLIWYSKQAARKGWTS